MSLNYVNASTLPDPDLRPEFYAGIAGKRFGAWLVDLVIVAFAVVLIVFLSLFTGLFFLPVLWLAIDFTYRTVTLANGSATWGQRLMGIELRDANARRFDLSRAALHSAGYLLSMSFVLPQLISVILILCTANRQSLTDVILGSAAINKPAEAY